MSALGWQLVTSGRVISDPGGPDPFATDPGFPPLPGVFILMMLIALALGVGSAVLRYRTGSRIAERAGLNPEDGGMTSLLSENGLPAAYVMSNLPGRTQPAASPRTVEQRLGDLTRLRDQGLITPEEYETRRTRIIDEV